MLDLSPLMDGMDAVVGEFDVHQQLLAMQLDRLVLDQLVVAD